MTEQPADGSEDLDASDQSSPIAHDTNLSGGRPEPLDRDAISRVVRVVHIEKVRLRMLHTELNVNPPVQSGWSSKTFVRWEPNLASREGDRFTASLDFLARWRSDWDPGDRDDPPDYDIDDPPGLELAVAFELEYRLSNSEGISDEDLRHFCIFNATANAWPYWREIAQATTARMGIEPLMIDVLPVPRIGQD